jgi:Flp pilus assembly protein TadG
LDFAPPDVTPLTVNTWAQGNIPTAGGVQWFSFEATAETQYIHFNTSGTLKDVYVRVVDSSGTIIIPSQNNLYGTGSTLRTSRTLTIGQTYYLRVWPYSFSGTNSSGTYFISFNASMTAPAAP